MNPIWHDATRPGFGVDASQLFNVILVYGDQASALHGLTLYQRLVSELGAFNLSLWKFAVLGVRQLAEISAEQAADADLLIVCKQDEATQQVPAWLECWLDVKSRHDCALMLLGDAAREAAEAAREDGFFQELARHGGRAFFPPAANTPTDDPHTAAA